MTSHLCGMKSQFSLHLLLKNHPFVYHCNVDIWTPDLQKGLFLIISTRNPKGYMESAVSSPCLNTQKPQMAGVSDLQTTCASKRLIHAIAFSQSEFTSELVSHVFKFQLCGGFKSKQGPHIWEHQHFSFSAECVGRGSSLNQKGLTDMHAPAVDPFSPSGQQWEQKESMLHGGRID